MAMADWGCLSHFTGSVVACMYLWRVKEWNGSMIYGLDRKVYWEHGYDDVLTGRHAARCHCLSSHLCNVFVSCV